MTIEDELKRLLDKLLECTEMCYQRGIWYNKDNPFSGRSYSTEVEEAREVSLQMKRFLHEHKELFSQDILKQLKEEDPYCPFDAIWTKISEVDGKRTPTAQDFLDWSTSFRQYAMLLEELSQVNAGSDVLKAEARNSNDVSFSLTDEERQLLYGYNTPNETIDETAKRLLFYFLNGVRAPQKKDNKT